MKPAKEKEHHHQLCFTVSSSSSDSVSELDSIDGSDLNIPQSPPVAERQAPASPSNQPKLQRNGSFWKGNKEKKRFPFVRGSLWFGGKKKEKQQKDEQNRIETLEKSQKLMANIRPNTLAVRDGTENSDTHQAKELPPDTMNTKSAKELLRLLNDLDATVNTINLRYTSITSNSDSTITDSGALSNSIIPINSNDNNNTSDSNNNNGNAPPIRTLSKTLLEEAKSITPEQLQSWLDYPAADREDIVNGSQSDFASSQSLSIPPNLLLLEAKRVEEVQNELNILKEENALLLQLKEEVSVKLEALNEKNIQLMNEMEDAHFKISSQLNRREQQIVEMVEQGRNQQQVIEELKKHVDFLEKQHIAKELQHQQQITQLEEKLNNNNNHNHDNNNTNTSLELSTVNNNTENQHNNDNNVSNNNNNAKSPVKQTPSSLLNSPRKPITNASVEEDDDRTELSFLQYVEKIVALGKELVSKAQDSKNFHLFRFYHKLDELVQAVAELIVYVVPSFRREMVKYARNMLTSGCVYICARERGAKQQTIDQLELEFRESLFILLKSLKTAAVQIEEEELRAAALLKPPQITENSDQDVSNSI